MKKSHSSLVRASVVALALAIAGWSSPAIQAAPVAHAVKVPKVVQQQLSKTTAAKGASQKGREDQFIISGWKKVDAGDYTGAVTEFTKAININPDSPEALLGRAIAYLSLGNEKGFDDLKHCLDVAPDYAPAYMVLGAICVVIEDYETAIAAYATAAQLFKEQGNTQGQQAALAELNKLKSHAKSKVRTSKQKAAKVKIGKDMQGKQLASKKSSKSTKGTAKASEWDWVDSGHAKLDKDDCKGAAEDYSKALKMNPKNTEALTFRCIARLCTGDFEGLQDLNSALTIDPEYALGWYVKGLIDVAFEDFPAAIADFSKAAQLFKAQGDTEGYKAAQAQVDALKQQGHARATASKGAKK